AEHITDLEAHLEPRGVRSRGDVEDPGRAPVNKSNAVRAAAGAYEGETRWSVKSGTGCRRRSSSRIQVTLFVFFRARPHPKFADVRTTSASGCAVTTFRSPASFVRPYTFSGCGRLRSLNGPRRPSKT